MVSNQVKKVCLFGTSANPPTGINGHGGIISTLASLTLKSNDNGGLKKEDSQSLQFDEIRVLPVYKHMFSEKQDQASFQHRLEMCKLSFKDIQNVRVSDQERQLFHHSANERGIKSEEEKLKLRLGTFDLINFFNAQNRSNGITEEYTLAMGADTFMDLTCWKWKNSKEIIKLIGGRFVVKLRHSDNSFSESDLKDRIDSVNKEFQDSNEVPLVQLNVRLLHDQVSNTSSTAARSTCDESILAITLQKDVIEYIKTNKLYSFSDNYKSG